MKQKPNTNSILLVAVLTILILFLQKGYCVSFKFERCQQLLNSKDNNFIYPDIVWKKIERQRPDLWQAIHQRNPKLLKVQSEILSSNFYREKLPKFFKDGDLFDPIVLYRSINTDEFSPEFSGEMNLIWTFSNVEEAFSFALNSPRSQLHPIRIVKIIAPRFLVYQRSGWPVLRLEDVPDLRPFIEKFATINISLSLQRFLEENPGDETQLIKFLKNHTPRVFDETSKYWSMTP